MVARKPLVTVDGVTQEMASGDSVSVGRGGTELTSYSVGDLIYASGTAALSKLAAAAAGNVLLSGTSPSWGKVSYAHVDDSIVISNMGYIPYASSGLYAQSPIFTDGTLVGVGGITSPTAALHLGASSTSRASLRVPVGTAPASPNNGDVFNVSSTLKFYDGSTTKTFAFLESPSFTTPTTNSLTISGNQSAAAWTTNGIRLVGASGTLTDTTSSGTVATAYTNKLGGNTIAASSTTTFTNYVSSYFSDPVAGTNVTFTNKWALGGDSLRIGTSNHLTVTTAGVLTCTSPVFTTPTLGAASATSLTSSIVYGGTGSGGNLSLTSTTHGTKGNVVFNGISYVSSTGVFFGDLNGTLTGNVIGSVSGSSGSCTGNAATATTLQTTRTIGGSSFNGSANVTSFPEPGAIGGTTPSTIAATSLACPTFTTASGAMGFTPAAGSNFNITLSTTGDFTVNTNQLYVDTSAGNVGIGITSPDSKIHAVGTGRVAHFAGSDDTSSVYLHFNTSSSSGLGHFGVEGSTPGATITGTLAYATFLTASSSGSALQLGTPGGVRATITSGGNFCIGITAAGTSAAGVLAIKNGTQGAALTDAIQIVSEDLSAGNTILSLRTEGGGCFAAGTPAAASGSIAIKIDGTVRYFTVSNSPAA